jgi:ABC-2 type transport system permease protein
MRSALALQVATFGRSLTAPIATLLIVLAPALAGLGIVALVRSDIPMGPSAAKFAPYLEGPFGEAVAAATGQIIGVVALIAGGFAVAWSFGREWADGSIGSLFSLPTSRRAIATAKIAVIGAWMGACVTAAVLLAAAGAAVVAPEGLTGAAADLFLRDWIAGLFMGALALPFAWVAVRFHGYLGATASIIAVTAISQVLASLGVGGWVPYVAPELWSGAGGVEAAAGVGIAQLAWAAAFIVAGTWLSVRAFATVRID